MDNKKYIFVFLFALFFAGSIAAQNRKVDSLKKALDIETNDSVKVDIMSDIGGYLIRTRNYSEALAYLSRSKELAGRIGFKRGLSNALLRIGIFYMDHNDYAVATSYYEKALALKKELNDRKGIADVISNIGIIYSDQGNYARALEKYFTALKIREDIDDSYGTVISMMSIANIYFLQGKFNTALEYYQNVLELKEVYNNKFWVAETYGNMGLTYSRLNNFQKALHYYSESLKMCEEIKDKLGIATAYTNIGAVYSTQKNYDLALELIWKGANMFKDIDDKKGIAESYYELGSVYDSAHQYDRALECFQKQLTTALEISSKINVKNAYQGLSNHFERTGNFKEAHRYYKLYKSVEDSLQSESGIKSIAELEAQYKTQKKEKEIELLKKEQDLKDATYSRQKQLLYGSIILFVAVSITIFLLYNRQQLKKKALLEKKNFVLERNALSVQMNPHFVFNSLGSISGFIIENEKQKAVEYLNVFARLIRHNLEQSREQMVTVTAEAEMLNSYLHLEQMRYDNKFDYEVLTDDSVDATVSIPPMFVQPFVENSILHGIIPKEGRGKVTVMFYIEDDRDLVCEITDDGIGKDESMRRKNAYDKKHRSLAMTIISERMEIINSTMKEKIKIEMKDRRNDNKEVIGTKVRLCFPLSLSE